MTRTQIINAMETAKIKGEVRGSGKNVEIELPDDNQKKKFCKNVANFGGFKAGYGAWVLRPDYQTSPLYYPNTD